MKTTGLPVFYVWNHALEEEGEATRISEEWVKTPEEAAEAFFERTSDEEALNEDSHCAMVRDGEGGLFHVNVSLEWEPNFIAEKATPATKDDSDIGSGSQSQLLS
jgi:hypothetical protein